MKQAFIDRVNREMAEDLPALKGSTSELLAACCRILAAEGHESGLAGQVTARGERPGTWRTLEFGYVRLADGFVQASAELPAPWMQWVPWVRLQ